MLRSGVKKDAVDDVKHLEICAVWRSDVDARTYARMYVRTRSQQGRRSIMLGHALLL